MTPAESESELATTPIWKLTQARYQFLRGIKQPHILELGPTQLARFSKRGLARYQEQRGREWDASGNCKVEYNERVWEAYQRGEFNEQTEGVTQDAKRAVFYGLSEARKQETAERMKAAQVENQILSVNDAEIGDTVYALYGSRYVKIVGKFRTSFKVQDRSGGPTFTVKARACQWLHYNELVLAVEERRPINPHRAQDEEPEPPTPPAQAAAPTTEQEAGESEAQAAPQTLQPDDTPAGQGVTVERAEQLIRYEMETRGIIARGWSFKFDQARKRLGSCDYEHKCLTFSIPFIELNAEAELIDTIRHEIAHVLAGPQANHGRIWKAHAIALGCRPEPCGGSNIVSPEMRYHTTCGTCGNKIHREHLPRARTGHLARTGRGRRRLRTGDLIPVETFCSRCLNRYGRTRANFEKFKLTWIETRTGQPVEWPPKPVEAPPAIAAATKPEVWTVKPIINASQPSLF